MLENGSALEMPWRDDVDAIVETYLAGEAVGEATWDILLGKVNPSGKLAESFPVKLADNPSYLEFDADLKEENYRESIFVGYRYYDKKQIPVLFPFGYGLSYTTFSYTNLHLSDNSEKILIQFDLENTGEIGGAEIAQLYFSNQASRIEKPIKELKNFVKVYLEPGEKKTINCSLNQRDLSWYNPEISAWQLDNGRYEIFIGSSSRDIRLDKSIEINWKQNKNQEITLDSYLVDILKNEKLKKILEESDINESVKKLSQDDSSREIMTNMPLRSLTVMGITNDQIDRFIEMTKI